MAAAHLGTRVVGWARGRPRPAFGVRPVLGALLLLLVPPVLVVGSVVPYLAGYRGLFQRDLPPGPGGLPGGAELPGEQGSS